MQNYATSKNYIEDQRNTYLHIDSSFLFLHLCDPNTETPRSIQEWWGRLLVSTCQVQIYSNYLGKAPQWAPRSRGLEDLDIAINSFVRHVHHFPNWFVLPMSNQKKWGSCKNSNATLQYLLCLNTAKQHYNHSHFRINFYIAIMF